LPVTLAVSLHAANDRLRDELVPINKRYPIDELCDAMIGYREQSGRRVSIEWALIKGVNDSDRDAKELTRIARRTRAHVNLIPLNPTPGYPVVGAAPKRLFEFRDLLEEGGATATVRRTRGLDIDAACGQLAARHRSEASNATEQPVAGPSRRSTQLRD
jgi:23S rRNA (adenine2503-C2)-methyltransferase